MRTTGCAQHPQRTQSGGQVLSGAVSDAVHVSGDTRAIAPEASANRISRTAHSRTRFTLFLYSTNETVLLTRPTGAELERCPSDGAPQLRPPSRSLHNGQRWKVECRGGSHC